jgi:hypothetical protein
VMVHHKVISEIKLVEVPKCVMFRMRGSRASYSLWSVYWHD